MGGDILDWLAEHVLPWLIILFIVAIILGIPFLLYYSWMQEESPTLTLYKNEWTCTQTKRVPSTIYVKSGNVMIPVTTYHNECYQWSKQS